MEENCLICSDASNSCGCLLRLSNNPSDGFDAPEWGVWRKDLYRDEGGEIG